MSFAEVLAAARELTADERHELLRELAETPVDEGIPEHLRQFIPPPGFVAEFWHPTTDAAGWEAIQQALAEIKAGGTT